MLKWDETNCPEPGIYDDHLPDPPAALPACPSSFIPSGGGGGGSTINVTDNVTTVVGATVIVFPYAAIVTSSGPGLTIATVTLQDASTANGGVVSTIAQGFAGAKTFTGGVTVSNSLPQYIWDNPADAVQVIVDAAYMFPPGAVNQSYTWQVNLFDPAGPYATMSFYQDGTNGSVYLDISWGSAVVPDIAYSCNGTHGVTGLSGSGDVFKGGICTALSGAPAMPPVFTGSGAGSSTGVVPDPGGVAGLSRFLREDAAWAQVPAFVGSGTSHASGAVPDPGSVAGLSKFLREDASWAVPPTGSTPPVFVGSGTGHASGLVPDPGAVAGTVKFLREDASWQIPPVPPVFVASGASHASGLVPDPGTSPGTAKFLREDATWVVPPMPSVFVASGASHATGVVPDPGVSAGTTKFLREDASWQVPPVPSVFVASGASHATGVVPDPGSGAGTSKFLREDATWVAPGGFVNALSGGAVTTTSTTYVDLGGQSLTFTLDRAGTICILHCCSTYYNSGTPNGYSYVSIWVDGTNYQSTISWMQPNWWASQSLALQIGLAAGSHTVTIQNQTNTGISMGWTNRMLMIWRQN